MGFKCSVLGHRFEEPGLVTERERRGEEVITVRRKVMDCTICGKQRVLAERKEITSQTRTVEDDDASEPPAPGGNTEDASSTSEASPQPDTAITPSPHEQPADTTAQSTDWGGADETQTATTDDAVILSDTESTTDEQWHHTATENADTQLLGDGPAPTAESDDPQLTEPIDPATDDGEILATEPNHESDSTTDEDHSTATARTVAVLSCDNCSFDVTHRESPFRSGDLCPHCHESYLTATEKVSSDTASTR